MRSSSTARALRGLPTTLLVQLWLALTASAVAAATGPVFDRRGVAHGDLRGALEVLVHAPDVWVPWAAVTAAALLAHLLALPALQLMWLHSLAHGESPGPSLRFGVGHYGTALRQSLCIGFVALVGGACLGLLPAWAFERLADAPEPRRVTVTALCLLPLGLWLLACGLWHDLARAQLATHGALGLRGLWAEGLSTLRPSHFVPYLLALALCLALTAAAPLSYAAGGDLVALAGAQALLLSRSMVRSVWLAHATRLAHARGAR